MSKKRKNESKWKRPYPRTEYAEFGKPKGGLLACKHCSAYFYNKSWHHEINNSFKGKKIEFTHVWCPACAMIDNNLYEGKVIIADAPVRFIPDITKLIETFSRRAYRRDPQDRLIEIRKENNHLVATTTENQLAARLGKKIRETFKTANLKITHAPAPSDVTLARITFK